VPFEFPLYQWIVARTATTFHTPLDQTGRLVNEVFFALSLLLLWARLAEFRIRSAYRLIFLLRSRDVLFRHMLAFISFACVPILTGWARFGN
jgi:hypothetical protein